MGKPAKSLVATVLILCACPAAARAGEAPDDTKPLPVVDDPMLAPVPPAPNFVGSWPDIIRLVHQRSTALHIARAKFDQAEATTRRALSASLPTLTGTASLNHDLLHGRVTDPLAAGGLSTGVQIPNPDTTLRGAITLKQPLVNFGAWYSVGTAKEREREADLSAKDAQRTLLATVAEAAVGVVTAERVAESSRVSLASDLSTLDLTRRRAELGAANAVDVLRAAQEVASVRAQLVSADESLRQARETLGASLGFAGGWGVAADLRVEDLERTASNMCKPLQDVTARTDVLAAEREVRAAERDRKSVDYLYVPTLDFNSAVGYYSNTRSSGNLEHVTWSVGGALTWPLYDGGDRYGLRRVNEALETIAKEEFTQKKRDATLQLTQADRAIVVARTNVEVATSARDIAKESARLSKLAFLNGNGTSFDLVDSARRLREAEIDLVIKEFGVFQARLSAFLARSNCTI